MSIVYKVTSLGYDGEFGSAGLPVSSPYYTRYPINTVVLPPIGALFSYDTLEHAMAGMGRCRNMTIWEAETSSAKPGQTVCYVGIPKMIKRFWDGDIERAYYTYPADVGTLLCADIRLLKRIWVRKDIHESPKDIQQET